MQTISPKAIPMPAKIELIKMNYGAAKTELLHSLSY